MPEQFAVNAASLSPGIFKAYDIRGVVDKTLTAAAARAIGAALGLLARAKGVTAICVGRDGRLSGPELIAALAQGIHCAGVDTIDIGMVPTPLVYFANFELGTGSGVVVTGSHNPPEYNGIKMVIAGETLHGAAIQQLYQAIVAPGFTLRLAAIAEPGKARSDDVAARYIARITGDVRLARPMKIAVDCGNGVAGATAPALLRALGCELVELFCDVDGNFPNHHPDPSKPENLQDLIRCLAETDAELGIAFDGDGDRLGVVTKDGRIIYPDRQLMLFAADVLARQPGAQVIYDVKCSRNVASWVQAHGGRPLMSQTGHSLVKARLKETGAALAGEMSGHVFFKERWYGFDDGLYAAARLLEILSRQLDPSAVLNALPDSLTTPELQLPCAEGENFTLVEKLRAEATFDGASEIITIDGVRVEYPDGFGLARPSNTTPVVVLRFEGDTAAALARIQEVFRREILRIAPNAKLPF